MLSVHSLSKAYGARRALDGVSFALQPGQFCALLGPNGAGKSTLFQTRSGLFAPDAGQILVDQLGEKLVIPHVSQIAPTSQQSAAGPHQSPPSPVYATESGARPAGETPPASPAGQLLDQPVQCAPLTRTVGGAAATPSVRRPAGRGTRGKAL